ncbi:hypothetical protein QBC40DRAFT_276032 [Triangularia verruculosa]|uniref:WW domain-containing protein n=1 Tax=Triangularia verruculosa TaxID=2587418 RepID=A0AAN7AX09_9PEZI|nr:hypothetical protein QBC40DRAFT_276032 [Triangularia verruculosa]
MSTPAETESPTPPVAPEERIENADPTPQKEASPAVDSKEEDATGKTTPPPDEANSNKPNGEEPSTSPRDKEGSPSPSQASSDEEGEISESEPDNNNPPLPNEPLPGNAPPLPNEPLPGATDDNSPPLPTKPTPAPETVDDGWDYHWNPNDNQYWFYNRFTGVWQLENPRQSTTTTTPSTNAPIPPAPGVPTTTTTTTPIPPADPTSISNPTSISGGYNPAIHGSYDENAWYAVNARALQQQAEPSVPPVPAEYAVGGYFNKQTGQWQVPEQGAERHSDEQKSRRQMNAYFDVDAAANMHDGRSLKAERAGKKPSKKELKEFKEKRRARKEEKRRAWLRD